MKRMAVVLIGVLVLALAACGDDDGGGSATAFCDDLETLSDQITDGELVEDIDGVIDTVNDLIESAPSENLDAVNNVGSLVGDLDVDEPDEVEDAIGEIQDELGDVAEDDCDVDDFALAPTTTTTEESTTTTGETTSTTLDDSVDVGARQEIPADLEAEFAELAQRCFVGDAAGCDELYQVTPVGSVAEAYGGSCGGRLDAAAHGNGRCQQAIVPAQPVPAAITDPTARAQAEACLAGTMGACDELFRNATEGSPEQVYGGLCGGRVVFTTSFCVPIFGEQFGV
jgi:hypothetical protein